MQEVMARVRLHVYAVLSEHSPLADAISTKILCAGPYHIYSNIRMGLRFRSHNNYILIAKMANYANILISLVILRGIWLYFTHYNMGLDRKKPVFGFPTK